VASPVPSALRDQARRRSGAPEMYMSVWPSGAHQGRPCPPASLVSGVNGPVGSSLLRMSLLAYRGHSPDADSVFGRAWGGCEHGESPRSDHGGHGEWSSAAHHSLPEHDRSARGARGEEQPQPCRLLAYGRATCLKLGTVATERRSSGSTATI